MIKCRSIFFVQCPYLIVIFLLLLAFSPGWVQSLSVGQFYSPPDPSTNGAALAEDPIWTVGEIKAINFTTTYSKYTVAFWQESLTGGEATMGPILYDTDSGDGGFVHFDWVVQTYNFNLDDSNVFYFWLHSGDASDQGSAASLSVTSHYLNITGDSESTGSSATTDSTTAQGSSIATGTATITGMKTTKTSNTAKTTSITESPTTAGSASDGIVAPTGSLSKTATATASPTNTTEPGPHGGVPTKITVAIVIGVCLFGVPGLLGCLVYFWRRRKEQNNGKSKPGEVLKAGKDDDQGSTSTEAHPSALELDNDAIKGELMAEPFFRGQYQELHERYVKPDLELLAEPFLRDRIQEVHGHSCGPELHSESCGPELPAEAVLGIRLRESQRRSRRVHIRAQPGTEPWAGNWAELGFRAELP